MLVYVQRHRRFRRYHILARMWPPDWSRLREIVRIGFPIGLMLLAEVGLFSVAAFLMGWLGTDEVAAHAIALQCASLAFMVPLGLSQATTVRVGLAYGRRDPEGIRKAGWMSLMLTLVLHVGDLHHLHRHAPHASSRCSSIRPTPATTNALMLGATYVVIAGLFQLVDGAQVSAARALRGISDTKWPLIIALIGYWLVGMPIAYVCGFVLGWRGVGIWTGLAFGLAVVAVVLVARFALRERLGLLKWQSALTPAEQRVADALAAHGLPGTVIVLEQLATTAQMAADALGIEVGRIVKSLLFKGATSGKPYLLLVSGANRVHEKRAGRLIGEALERSDADFVKAAHRLLDRRRLPLRPPRPARDLHRPGPLQVRHGLGRRRQPPLGLRDHRSRSAAHHRRDQVIDVT